MLKSPLMLGLILLSIGTVMTQESAREQGFKLPETVTIPAFPLPQVQLDPAIERLVRYTALGSRHRLKGLASYYSNSLDGTLTANGERYHRKRMSAAHLTLPLGCWVEIKAKATGNTIRLRVNDRGPYVKKFVIDLSRKAARILGVDVAEDRTVTIRIIGLPGEKPLPEDVLTTAETVEALPRDGQTEGTALAQH
jgi:rare lipoprotein A